jgi:lysophospholipase L1-like esterase
MKRLIVFGPSSSYGIGLENRDEEVWGAILSKKLGRKFINESVPGASNKLIAYKSLNFNFKKDDLVLILWSFPDRYTVLKSEKEFINFMPSNKDENNISYYKNIHEDYDHVFMSKIFIDYTISKLNKNGIYPYSLFEGRSNSQLLIQKQTLIPIYSGDYDKGYPRAKDGIHIGIEGQIDFAEMLYKFFKKNVI